MYNLLPLGRKTICPITDVTDIVRLQACILESLPDSKKNYIKKRTEDDYIDLISKQSLFGLYWDSQLVASVIFTKHESHAYQTDFNQTKQFTKAVADTFDFGITGALMVRPEFQNNGFASELLAFVLTLPDCAELDCVFAETISTNRASISCFIDSGFSVTGHEFYANLQTDLCLLSYKPSADVSIIEQIA